jgi:hypothetical protein
MRCSSFHHLANGEQCRTHRDKGQATRKFAEGSRRPNRTFGSDRYGIAIARAASNSIGGQVGRTRISYAALVRSDVVAEASRVASLACERIADGLQLAK